MKLVSVICLCHNQGKFVTEALFSVINQTYSNYELIIVDDGSTDNSKTEIQNFLLKHSNIQFINIQDSIGNCKAFNNAFRHSKGDFIIDFAADDIMEPNRLQVQIAAFERLPKNYGIVYGDALNIDENGQIIDLHSDKYPLQPSGDIFQILINRYFISPPTMMIKREVLEALNGYDENLLYEDFDFWIRSSVNFFYYYQNQVLTRKRNLFNSHGKSFYKPKNKLQESTFRVCEKILSLCRNKSEFKTLAIRILYEMRQSIVCQNYALVPLYHKLFIKIDSQNLLQKTVAFSLLTLGKFCLFFNKFTS
jgi:glycosyltransferase involved in cell wall biosynthesis